ncbi:MAG: hypothetical protein KF852_16470 [Saprospiraceae bacterium]|nr:hypothetical protein [Saprospiraceae bacterium]
MNFQQAQILLEKINAMWRNINATPGTISPIERDLMLGYIRQLYEVFLALQQGQPAQQPIAPPAPQPQPRPVVAPPTPAPPRETPTVVAPPPKPVQTVPPPSPKVETPAPAPPKPAPQPPKAPTTSRSASAYSSLFNRKSGSDLSDKLSAQPIADLTKAFAINDRLLYINDLFGKDQNAFNESVRTLDRFEDMDEAKGLLVNLAEQYDWLQEERVETAQDFVQLVQRRYLR